jgi:hypothetical protein
MGKPPLDRSYVLLQATHHHVIERSFAANLDAASESVGIEQLEECGEAVRVTVMRRRRKEQPVLEAAGEIAHGPGELGLDSIASAACRT